MGDFIQIRIENLTSWKPFLKANGKVFPSSHCSRRYMDGMHRATFNPSVPFYICLINQAVTIRERIRCVHTPWRLMRKGDAA